MPGQFNPETPALRAASAFADDALGDLDTVGLLAALASGERHPAELREAAIARSRAVDGDLNAVVEWAPEPSKASWRNNQPQPDDRPLAGIPTFLKDNEDLAGCPTRYGSAATPATPAVTTSLFATQLQDLGLDIIGKSSLPEFGLTATSESLGTGPTRNPRNLDHSAGGSSGGSAALVAAGVVPIAHANDGGGSIRIPASCCGLVGLKP
ncbi:MAG: amidase, partial [Actinobacteria bacterium]|nr:amidase [Actinomycetota bacterium]